MNIEEKINVIKKSEIFQSLSDEDIKKVADVSDVIKYKKGEIIFEENSKADGFYIISEGEVEILKKFEDDNTNEVLAIKRGFDVFGEMAVIDDLPRSATIRSRTKLVLLRLSKTIFNELLKSFSHISIEIARNICYTVRSTNEIYIKDLEKRNRQLNAAYKKIKKTQNELIRLEKLSVVGKFASLIIHDIKNPMSNIKAYAELIKMNISDNNQSVNKSAEVIIGEVDRLNNMTMELLEFSRGDMHINKTPVNIVAFISTMIDVVKDDFKKKDIEIIFNEKEENVVMLDIDKMKRVFFNIINNASDALLRGGKIFVRVTNEDNWIKWSIQDNGIGMEPDVLEKIFEPFFSRKKSGTGLGMTIVKGIIENHGGHIKALSKKDTGTKFDIYLPKV